jgi:4-hydroxy-tetrahydrodipicolinate synthase
MKQFQGAITAIVTPFKVDGNIDLDALRNLVRFQLEGKIDGIVPCGSTGEAATLTDEEYRGVIKIVVEEVAGKVPVIAGAGSNNTERAVQLSRIAKATGVDGLLHVTPFYNKPTINGLIAHYKAIAEAVDLPIILYNVPGRTGQNVSDVMTLQIAKSVPQVIGVKEASGNIMQIMEIVKNAPENFSILSGDDAMTLPLISVGGHGCISVVANEVPEAFSTLIRYALEDDFVAAKKFHYQLLDLMNVNFIETNPIPVKTALSLMGKIEEYFRLPLVPMEEKNKEVLKSVMKGVELL